MKLVHSASFAALTLASLLAATGLAFFVEDPQRSIGEPGTPEVGFFSTPVRVVNDYGFEPSVRVDSTGVIYVAIARALQVPVPVASWVWRSTDNGATWTKLANPLGNRVGAEPEIALDAQDRLYYTDLEVANTYVATYTNHGLTVESFNPIGQTTTGVDRQWFAVGKPKEIFLNTNDVERGMWQYYSPDITLAPTTAGRPITNLPHVSTPPAYDPTTGYVFTVYEGFGTLSSGLYVGRTMAPTTVPPLPVVTRLKVSNFDGVVSNVFPVMAVDDAGNEFIVWSQEDATGGMGIYLTWSTNNGNSWATPVRVNQHAGAHVFPWMVADDAGHVAIAWLGTDEVAPSEGVSNDAPWQVHFSQSLNVLSGSPTFTESHATGTMHVGKVCVSGLACDTGGGADRDLGDYIQIALGPDGMAHIAYTDDQVVAEPQVYHVRQTGGSPT